MVKAFYSSVANFEKYESYVFYYKNCLYAYQGLTAPRKPSGFRGKLFWVTATEGGSSDFGT